MLLNENRHTVALGTEFLSLDNTGSLQKACLQTTFPAKLCLWSCSITLRRLSPGLAF